MRGGLFHATMSSMKKWCGTTLAVLATGAVAGCGGSGHMTDITQAVAAWNSVNARDGSYKLNCPSPVDPGTTFDCKVTGPRGSRTVKMRLVGSKRALDWADRNAFVSAIVAVKG
jgi:hypothetical protein